MKESDLKFFFFKQRYNWYLEVLVTSFIQLWFLLLWPWIWILFSGCEATFLKSQETRGWFTSTILFTPLVQQGQSWSESTAGIKGGEHPGQLLWTTGKKFQPGLVLQWNYLLPKVLCLNVFSSLWGNCFSYSITTHALLDFKSQAAVDLNSSQKGCGSGTTTHAPPHCHTREHRWAKGKMHILISVWGARRLTLPGLNSSGEVGGRERSSNLF